MAISLNKGANISLTKEAPSMNTALVGLGWDARSSNGQAFDLDCSIFMLGENGRISLDENFIFFNNKKSPCGAVIHQGDNLTGEGDGDDEQVLVSLDKVNPDVQRLIFAVTIYEAESRRQNFGQVARAYMRIVNKDNNAEIARFDLSEDAAVETAMIFGELYRHNGEWKFKAVGQGFVGGLSALAKEYGVNI